jgi:hypothetical protein
MNDLPKLLEETADTSAAVSEMRAKTVRAIRLLESNLVAALGHDKLRGMPTIALDAGDRMHGLGGIVGANVRKLRIDDPLRLDRETLLLLPNGRFYFALPQVAVTERGGAKNTVVQLRAALDEDFSVEDVERVTQSVAEVLSKHLESVDTHAGARFAAAERLADALERVLAA